MSTAAVSTSSIYQQVQAFYQQRRSDLQQLGQALQSGDLAGAQAEFSALQTLGQGGPFANGDPFQSSQREQDFAAIGQALQSGDLAGAQQAFAELQSTFQRRSGNQIQPAVVVDIGAPPQPSTTPAPSATSTSSASQSVTSSSPSPATGTEIVLNLGAVTPGEQITIGLSNTSNGGEQITIGVAGQQNQAPEQITLDLNQNSNQQIVLNLLDNSAPSSTTQSSGLNVTA